MRTRAATARRWRVALLLAASACGAPTPSPRDASPPAAPRPTVAGPTSVEAASPANRVAARVRRILDEAAALEPELTPKLVSLVEEVGGAMYKLEHRLKTAASTERKLRTALSLGGVSVDEVVIDDALRYTMRIDDEPPGRHVRAIKKVIDELTAMGHEVVRLKNYWPQGDNYSGINGVFRAPGGMLWELQLHTSDSIRVQAETRDEYEELRRLDTPLDRRRELFDAMTQIWQQVPVPEGILTPGALHPKAEIIDRPRP